MLCFDSSLIPSSACLFDRSHTHPNCSSYGHHLHTQSIMFIPQVNQTDRNVCEGHVALEPATAAAANPPCTPTATEMEGAASAALPTKPMADWTCQEVTQWLVELNPAYECYVSAFLHERTSAGVRVLACACMCACMQALLACGHENSPGLTRMWLLQPRHVLSRCVARCERTVSC